MLGQIDLGEGKLVHGGTKTHNGLYWEGTPIADANMTPLPYASRDGNLEKVLEFWAVTTVRKQPMQTARIMNGRLCIWRLAMVL